MENPNPSKGIDSINKVTNDASTPLDMEEFSPDKQNESGESTKPNTEPILKDKTLNLNKTDSVSDSNADKPKKPVKPPKIEDKPFLEFIDKHFIPGLKSSIENKGVLVKDIKLIDGIRPVVGGKCWIVYCEISQQRRFWLCFNNDIISSDKTILLAESNSEPSIVESFLIDEKKTTLPLLISRVLQRLNGQKWIGVN